MPKKNIKTHCDVIIIGAGPIGLSFARALGDTGLKITLIEKHPEKTLASPPVDGRDIALTHLSHKLLKDLGLWSHIPAGEVSIIKEAKVLNGKSDYSLHFDYQETGYDNLGWLVPNHLIRKAAYKGIKTDKNIKRITGVGAETIKVSKRKASVVLSDGQMIEGVLIVAADSRFSKTREKMGISAAMYDFDRVCIVCEMTHEEDHHHTAYECFHFEQTLAVLPLTEKKSSVVITLPADKAEDVMKMKKTDFNEDIQMRFEDRLGKMTLTGKRHAYPLVGVYADQFIAERFALIGDAAVGMHPVTAHGFNLGLRGACHLAEEIKHAQDLGLDIGSQEVLKKYQSKHRRVTRPLYLGTNALVKLYTDERLPAKIARRALLRLGNKIRPVKRAIMGQLTEIDALSA